MDPVLKNSMDVQWKFCQWISINIMARHDDYSMRSAVIRFLAVLRDDPNFWIRRILEFWIDVSFQVVIKFTCIQICRIIFLIAMFTLFHHLYYDQIYMHLNTIILYTIFIWIGIFIYECCCDQKK
eukprot:365849_1